MSGLRGKAEPRLVLAATETAPGKIKGGAGWDEYIREDMRPCEWASVRTCI